MPANISPSALDRRIIACTRCPRLRDYCQKVALEKKAAFRGWDYWGQPVPNFWPQTQPTKARILLVGLAPAAHGGNRTGRMFTGDRSGDFLYAALHEVGLATQPTSKQPGDGLELRGCAITAAAHCAPPANKLTREELENCLPWLDETFDAMPALRSVVCLGKVAFDQTIKLYRRRGWIEGRSAFRGRFSHAAEFTFPAAPTVLCSYHPSQQNTFTGRLTRPMLVAVLSRAVEIARS